MQKILLFPLVAFLILMSGSYSFSGTRFENAPGIDVTVMSPTFADGVVSGYFKVDVTVMNTGNKPADIELHFKGDDYYSKLKDLSNSAVVQAGSAVTLPIYIPPCNFQGNLIEVQYNGRRVGYVQCNA